MRPSSARQPSCARQATVFQSVSPRQAARHRRRRHQGHPLPGRPGSPRRSLREPQRYRHPGGAVPRRARKPSTVSSTIRRSGCNGPSGDPGNDRIRAGSGADLICAGSGNDRVAGGWGNDRLSGEGGNDRLLGGAGRDLLRGGRADEILLGGPGRDRPFGGPGRDRLIGGPRRPAEATAWSPGRDAAAPRGCRAPRALAVAEHQCGDRWTQPGRHHP